MLMFDPLYLIIAGPGILFAIVCGLWVKSAYSKALQIPSRRGMTGADVARDIIDSYGCENVKVEPTSGILTDHYHPLDRALRLSEKNYDGNSLAAIGVAAHEAGHAIQHKDKYLPMYIRSFLAPASALGSNLGVILFTIGLLVSSLPMGRTMMLVAIVMFSAAVIFTLITLPVEFDASRRAMKILREKGILDEDELVHVKKILTAAAMTYVAAAAQAILLLLYMVIQYNRSNDD